MTPCAAVLKGYRTSGLFASRKFKSTDTDDDDDDGTFDL